MSKEEKEYSELLLHWETNRGDDLKFFNLTPNYTEEELKKAYRSAIKQVHPDSHPNDEIAKILTQEINAANDRLLKKFKSQRTPIKPFDDLSNYKAKKNEEIIKIIDEGLRKVQVKYQDSWQNFNTNSEDLLNISIDFQEAVIVEKDIEGIDSQFNSTLNKIKKEFKKLKNDFYSIYQIRDDDVKENLNYDVTLDEFFAQLISIRDKYSVPVILKEKIIKETKKYETYDNYNFVRNLIENSILKAQQIKILGATEKSRQELDAIFNKQISELHKEISQIFALYLQTKSKFEQLDNNVKNLNNPEINQEYTDLLTKLQNLTSMDNLIDVYVEIKKLESKIIFQSNIPQLNNIVEQSLLRGSSKLQESVDLNSKLKISTLIGSIAELYTIWKNKQEGISIYFAKLLKNINFEDIDGATKLIEFIKCSKSGVYLRKAESMPTNGDEYSFFLIEAFENNLQIYRVEGDQIASTPIGPDELLEYYIPLEAIIHNKKYLREYSQKTTEAALEDPNTKFSYYFYYSGDKINAEVNTNPNEIIYNQDSMKAVIEWAGDEEQFINKIITQIKSDVKAYNQNQCRTRS